MFGVVIWINTHMTTPILPHSCPYYPQCTSQRCLRRYVWSTPYPGQVGLWNRRNIRFKKAVNTVAFMYMHTCSDQNKVLAHICHVLIPQGHFWPVKILHVLSAYPHTEQGLVSISQYKNMYVLKKKNFSYHITFLLKHVE